MPMTPQGLLHSLPVDELAILRFLSAQAGEQDAFISTLADLLAKVSDCSSERFRLIVRKLEARGLVERMKLSHIGTEWTILAKVDDAVVGDPFVIPQNKAPYQVARKHALPLVGKVPARAKAALHFPIGRSDFTWHVTDAEGNPVIDCTSVRATLFRGRSTMGVGGVAVAGFDDVALESVGDGDYVARIVIGAAADTNSEYTVVVDARRGSPFGHWEIASAVTD